MGSLGYKSDESGGFAFCAAKSGFRSGVALQTVPNYKLGTPLVLILLISSVLFLLTIFEVQEVHVSAHTQALGDRSYSPRIN